jgi:hypothetical protein
VEDHVAVALSRLALGVETVEGVALKFDQDLAVVGALGRVADAAERERGDDSVVVLLQRG